MPQETDRERNAREIREKNERLAEAEARRRTAEQDAEAKAKEQARIKADAEATPGDHKLYDIKNPTRAIRTIYDGIQGEEVEEGRPSMKHHTIPPGTPEKPGIKRGVKLHESVVKEMADRNKAKPNSDLIIEPHQAD